MPIIIADEHVANFFTGQFFSSAPDKEVFLRQAKEFAFNTDAYMAALERVPIFSDEKIKQVTDFFSLLAQLIGEMGLARINSEKANQELRAIKNSLEARVVQRTSELANLVAHHQKTAADLFRLSQVVSQSTLMIYITELDGTIVYVNAEFERVTGWTAEDALGLNPRILKSPNTPPAVFVEMWQTILSGATWKGEIEDVCKDGRRFWAQVKISPLRDQAGVITHYVAIHDDITERKEVEHCLHQAAQQAEIASRAKSEILANMSHELRTPLNAIIGFSDLMIQEVFGPLGHLKYEGYVSDIHVSGEHLLDLINDILDVSAIEAGELVLHEEPLDVEEILTACTRLIGARATKGQVKVATEIAPALPALYADGRRLKQIVLNLLSNGVKFTQEGGSVTIEAAIDSAGDLILAVIDTGIGMDEAGIAKAMQRFGQVESQLDRKYEGTGLGLPLTKSLVELHGGQLCIKSKPGHGTTVTVRMPGSRVMGAGGDVTTKARGVS
jgi:PAS domain S-box-containing protein